MIVNDTYSLELRSDSEVAPGEETGLLGRVEHAFVPDRIDLDRHHGQTKWKLVELHVGNVEVSHPTEVEDIGPVKKGEPVSMIVRNVSKTRQRAQIMLIGTLTDE